MKDYLVTENIRNRTHSNLLTQLVKKAFGDEANVLVAHHVTFSGSDGNPVEIPSDDTLLFDHHIMRAAFGDHALKIMAQLSQLPSDQRDGYVEMLLADEQHIASYLP